MGSHNITRWKYIPGSNTGVAAAFVEERSPPIARINGRLDIVTFAKPNMDYAPEENMEDDEIDEILEKEFEGLIIQVPDVAPCTELIAKQLHPRAPLYVLKAVPVNKAPRKKRLVRAGPWK